MVREQAFGMDHRVPSWPSEGTLGYLARFQQPVDNGSRIVSIV